MQHTLVAVFDNRSDAQNALDELLASGFERSAVNLSTADPTGETDSLTGYSADKRDEVHEEGIGASIKRFFTGLFGSDNDEHVQKYANVVSRGHHAVTLVTDSEPEVERAADIIERFGPVDIDERHDQLMAGGANFSAGAGAAMGGVSYGTQSGSYGTQQGSLQTEANENRNYFATQNLNDPVPKGQTYQEPLGSSQSGSLTGSGTTLQGTSSLPGSDDASLGGTVQQANLQGQSLQRDSSLSGTETREGRAAIPVVQEDLKIGKREVQRGGVRVFSRVIETPVNESVNLREEHVNVQRRPVNEPISPSDATAFKEQSIEMRETAEEAVVQKTARVVEEVLVDKEVTQRQQQVKDTVRRTDVKVEQLNPEDSWHDHYASNYASSGVDYDGLAPAYRYGSEARRAEKFRDRSWNEVENDLKSDWDTRNTGPSTWERIKAAVRHGWDKVTPDMDSDDSYYRSDWTSNYAASGGTYDDYAPAYRYGTEARSKYAGRDWDEVESDLKSDWDARYGKGGSTWEKFKAAVRHGWDKITPDTDTDDSYYRSDWNSNYAAAGGTYDDYAPAYRYGTEAHSKYQGRNWDDVEPDLRSDWDTRYGKGGSTWERFKAAVRHGWDRVTD
jgi:uncharacterized protein (TIGR02271 family)